MTNANLDEEVIAKALHRKAIADRVKKYIKDPLEETITPLLKGDPIFFPEAIDIVMILIFIQIDLLGYLYTGDLSTGNSSKNAVKFLREYLGKIDARYKEVGGLLYHMLRHGWIHRFTPKRLKLSDGKILDFQFSFDRNREQHLMIGEVQGIHRLLIGLPVLYDDLLSAIDLYADDIQRSQELSDTGSAALEARREFEEENDLRKRRDSYIHDSDFDFIHRLLR